ncbi:Rieske [2Fe-2S] iron-sulfur domain - like 2 [Theobroma cacao]|nr:Rieske [2Fe-2S] iron-sulfur domain - like 2 [Theobroma cacao]
MVVDAFTWKSCRTQEPNSRPTFAFVRYWLTEEMRKAILQANNKVIVGCQIIVNRTISVKTANQSKVGKVENEGQQKTIFKEALIQGPKNYSSQLQNKVKSTNSLFKKIVQLGNVEFVVCRDDNGNIAAFHNVCRHHASLLVSGSGKKSCFTCPYRGPFLLLNMEKESLRKDDIGTNSFANEWLGSCLEILSLNGVDSPLAYVYRRMDLDGHQSGNPIRT